MSAPPIVVDGWGVVCGTCGAPFVTAAAAQLCRHTPSMLPVIPEGAPLPTMTVPAPTRKGPRYQAGPRTYVTRAARPPRLARALLRVGVWLIAVALAAGFALAAWRAFDRSTPAPGCGRACAPAQYTVTGGK